ncbi:inositol monophosphatase family protein [Adhaeribacter aquaticus]|uniref:inositol monophosphatase family protein n=1 Tax=Adhaeribacter aquaticus TaxID=299567 RepID=UPI000402684E|nr:inositol monophosphatase family protein [Adhaeribacter aquaticus]
MNLSELCQEIVAIAKKTGEFIRAEAAAFDRSKIEHKGLNDMVSYVDKQAEEQIIAGIKAVFPDSGFIAEEGTSDEKHEVYNWIIDPLDGTTNFIHGVPVFCVSIGLMERDEMVLGVIYEINQDECFYATKGGGAFLNGKPIKVTDTPDLANSLMVTGYPYTDFGWMQDYLQLLGGFMQKSHGVRRLGSAAADLAYVACGRFEGFFEFNLKPWDVAAGVVIVREAGGRVTKFGGSGDPVFGKELLATNGRIHDETSQFILSYWNKSEQPL